jgi:ATP-dependent DNA helicase RecG
MMRPEILNPLFAEVEALKGVGPGVAKTLARLGLTRAVDLAYHLPTGTIERLRVPAASAAMIGRIIIVDVTPFDSRSSAGRGPTRIFTADSDGNTITLTFFNNPGWAKKQLPQGEARTVSGKLEAYGDEWQIIHPEVLEGGAEPPLSEAVYPLTEGLTNRRMRELALVAIERAPELAEWVEPSLLGREGWRGWRSALAEAH